jgi:hypothetical protein
MNIRVVTPAPRDIWQEVLACDPDALVSQTPEWLDCICASSPYRDASRLYETSDGRSLVLPLVRRTGVLRTFGLGYSPPSSWGIGGIIAPGGPRRAEIAAVLEDLARHHNLRTIIRPNPRHGERWAEAAPDDIVKIPRVAHILDLEGGFDTVWSERFKSATRTKVRKAEKSGLTVECDSSGALVPVFYELFRRSVERWAVKQHEPLWLARWRAGRRDPLLKFRSMAQFLGAQFRLWIAFLDRRPAAAILVLQGRNAHYTRGAMEKELAGPTMANYLLHRRAIEDACLAGCRYYHMGESGDSGDLAHFKSRFGAAAYPYAEYRLEKLALTQWDSMLRRLVKRTIGFKDTADSNSSGRKATAGG